MNPRVKEARPLPNYAVHVAFSNGEQGVFDCTPYLHVPAFARLKDKRYFTAVRVKHDTLSWPNDEDFCPDTVYVKSKKMDSR